MRVAAPGRRADVRLDLTRSAAELTATLVDVPSVSGTEGPLADAVETALRRLSHLSVVRHGDAVVARTDLGRPTRIALAGHLDTVPVADNVPSHVDGDRLFGCGTTDMKSGLAVMLRVAAMLPEPRHDLTFVFYDNEEVEAARNGLGRIARDRPQWLDAHLALLLEPTDGEVEAGCQGTMRALVRTTGRRAHSARSWLGTNAIHAAAPVLATLSAYEPRSVTLEGCTYREGLNAVGISGGMAGNVIPDGCVVTVNFRFAPDRSPQQAEQHVRDVLAGHAVEVVDVAAGAPPGLAASAAQDFLAAVGAQPRAKYGWTDVARFAELGIPALNYGPGDPSLAHTREESVALDRIHRCEQVLLHFLG